MIDTFIPVKKGNCFVSSLLPIFINIPFSLFCKVLLMEFQFQTCFVFFVNSYKKYRFRLKKKKEKDLSPKFVKNSLKNGFLK